MKIVRTSETDWAPALNKGKYGQRRKPLGGEKMPCSLWELAPGKKSFPFHAHQVTEEALYIISGHAKVRTPDGETPLGPGDYVSFPPGSEAHQLINDGTEPCLYIGMSVTQGVDIVTYPDSGKIACAVGSFPTGKRFLFMESQQVDYFHGEKDAEE